LNVLIVGGSKFLGPHLVRSLRQRDHSVTLFNRGRSVQDVPYGVQTVVGDRERDMSLLAGRRFDAVIDTCGFVPRIVRRSAQALAQTVTHYTFISTMSVYSDPLGGNRAEEAALATIADPTVEGITGESYGPLKALCENEVTVAMAGRSLIVRPGLIVGPLDPTDRFTYWPHRFALGGDVLVPGDREHPISYIDVRDLAEWIVLGVERGRTGAFNASGDYSTSTMGGLVDACVTAAGSDARPVWTDEAFIAENGVEPWSDLPVWLPTGGDSLMTASSAKAVEAGLTYRPVLDTVSATLQWTRSQGLDRPLKAGLTRARELQLLAAYREQM
jgi:nucleoside-diphosphate-sugar epimerase